jgi:pimeloyl-ACP methyl ester carboxylesterase
MIRRGLHAAFTRRVDIPDDLIADLKGITYHTFATVLRQNSAYITERSVPERLAALDVPLLVIFGAADRRWDPSSAHLYDVVPNARVEMLPGVGHTPMFEAPEMTSKLLLDFVATGR